MRVREEGATRRQDNEGGLICSSTWWIAPGAGGSTELQYGDSWGFKRLKDSLKVTDFYVGVLAPDPTSF